MTSLQKRAIYILAADIILTIILVVIFTIKGGITIYKSDPSFRVVIDILYVGILALNLALMPSIFRKSKPQKSEVALDERDISILIKTPIIQLWAVIILLLAWVIILTEIYWNTGQIPVIYLSIIFFSIMIISSISYAAGILIGYWRINRNV
jgi:hypothetical protein